MVSTQVLSKAASFVGALREHGVVRTLSVPTVRQSRRCQSGKAGANLPVKHAMTSRSMNVVAASGNGATAPSAGLPIDLRGGCRDTVEGHAVLCRAPLLHAMYDYIASPCNDAGKKAFIAGVADDQVPRSLGRCTRPVGAS